MISIFKTPNYSPPNKTLTRVNFDLESREAFIFKRCQPSLFPQSQWTNKSNWSISWARLGSYGAWKGLGHLVEGILWSLRYRNLGELSQGQHMLCIKESFYQEICGIHSFLLHDSYLFEATNTFHSIKMYRKDRWLPHALKGFQSLPHSWKSILLQIKFLKLLSLLFHIDRWRLQNW